MRLAIDHKLTLSLPPGTPSSVLHLLLTPPSGPTQTVESWSVEVAGIGNAGRFTDGFGNVVHLVNQGRPEGDVRLAVRGVVTTRDTHGVLGRPGGEPVPALYKRVTPLTRVPVTVYGKFRTAREGRLDVLHALMARVAETLGPPPEPRVQTQMGADGSQMQSQGEEAPAPRPPAADYAHMFIGAARALDIPARFVTGYRLDDGDGLHAWAEAHDEALGWIGFDAWAQLCSTDAYVRLAVGLDADSARPLRTVPVGDVVQRVEVKAS